MIPNTSALVSMTEANQNFSKVARLVDEQGAVVILKNNSPRYVIIDFSEYDRFQEYRRSLVERTADRNIEENLEAFQELAKANAMYEMKAILEGLEDVKAGRIIDGETAINNIKSKYGM